MEVSIGLLKPERNGNRRFALGQMGLVLLSYSAIWSDESLCQKIAWRHRKDRRHELEATCQPWEAMKSEAALRAPMETNFEALR